MDFHALSRRDLQALAKRNGIKANMTNPAMADALAALPAVDGIEEYGQQPVAEPTSAAKPAVQAVAEEEEKNAPAEKEDEEKAPALGVRRHRATRRTQVEPVEAPATRKRAAASKAEKGDAAAGPTSAAKPAVQAVAEEEEKNVPAEAPAQEEAEAEAPAEEEAEAEAEAPAEEEDEEKAPALGMGRSRATRRARVEPVAAPATKKRAAASKTETAEAVPARTARGRSQRTVVSAAEDEAPKARPTTRRAVARKAGTEQEEQEEGAQSGFSDAQAAVPNFVAAPATMKRVEAAPARATRARSQKTVSWADEEAPKARSTSSKSSTEQEEQEEGTQSGVSDVQAAVPAPASSDEGDDGAAEMEEATDAQNEEQIAAAEAVPARTTRARRQRTVALVAEEEAPKGRRMSRRAVARKTSTEQEDEEKGTQGDASDMETAAPAPISSDERGDGAEEMEVAIDAHNEEQNEAVEERVEEEPRVAVPVRTTRTRSKRTVMPVADEEAPKTRRTSRRAVARKTRTEQEEEEKGTQGDVSDMGAAVSAPASSGEGGDGAEEIESTIVAQNEKQSAALEAVPARATRARRQRTVLPVAVEEAPKARRTSGRTGRMQEGEVQGQPQQDIASYVEAVVPAPVTSEMEADMEPQTKEQNELVEEQSEEDEGAVADGTPLVEEEPAVTEEEPQAEHVDSSVQEPLVHVQQCEATEDNYVASEDAEMVPDVAQATLTSGEATVGADFTSDHASEEDDDCTVEEELPVAEDVQQCEASEENEDCTAEEETPVEHVNSSVEETLIDVQQCEITETEEIHLGSEDAEMVPVDEVLQATEQDDFTSDVDHASEENEDCTVEEETPVAEHFDSSVQEPLVDDQKCEATEEIHLASEDAEMVPVNVVPQTSGEETEEADFTRDLDHASEENEEETPVADDVASELNAEETPVEDDVASEENAEETPVADDVDSSVQELVEVQQYEGKEIHLFSEDTEMVPVRETPLADDVASELNEEETPVEDDVASELNEEETPVADDVDSSVQELLVEVQQCEVTKEIHFSSEDTEMVPVNEVPQATLKSGEVAQDAVAHASDFASDVVAHASDREEVFPKASEKKEDIAADEVTNNTEVAAEDIAADEPSNNTVATNVMPERSEAMEEDVVEEVTDDENAVKESDFSCDLADVSVEEEGVVAAEEIQSSTTMDEGVQEVLILENLSQATVTDDEWSVTLSAYLENLWQDKMLHSSATKDANIEEVSVKEEGAVAADEMLLHSSATKDENVEEVVTVENLSQATVTDDEWSVTLSAYLENLRQDKMLHSSATKDENVEEVVTAENLSEAAVTDDEWAAFASARDFSDRITSPLSPNVFEDATRFLPMDSITVKESGFTGELMDVSVEEQGVMAADQMLQSSATKEENVEESGDLQAVTFSDHVASPLSAAKFSDHISSPLSLSLSMDSITVKPTVSEPAAVPLSVQRGAAVYGLSNGKMKITEPMSVQVKVAKKPEALGSLSVRRLKKKFKADDVPLCIYSNSGGENNTSEAQESEALSSLRKLRTEFNEIVAVAQENEVKEGKKSSLPLDALSLRQLRLKLKETLNAQNQKNREPTRVPLGRLDENAY